MTEEEAKKKWCPKSANTKTMVTIMFLMAIGGTRHQSTIDKVLSSIGNNKDVQNCEKCIGTGCMAWCGTAESGNCGMVLHESTVYTINS